MDDGDECQGNRLVFRLKDYAKKLSERKRQMLPGDLKTEEHMKKPQLSFAFHTKDWTELVDLTVPLDSKLEAVEPDLPPNRRMRDITLRIGATDPEPEQFHPKPSLRVPLSNIRK